MENKSPRRGSETWTVKQVLEAMSGPDYPPFIRDLLAQLQDWMATAFLGDNPALQEDLLFGTGERPFQVDMESLFQQLEWIEEKADILPSASPPAGKSEAVVLCLGLELYEGLRIAVDHAALFGRGACGRVWIVTDNWNMLDILRYRPHIQALAAQGISLRFILTTPWGWTEAPISFPSSKADQMLNWNKEGPDRLNRSRNDEAGSK